MHTTHVDGFFIDQTGRLNPSGQPHAIEGQGGAGAPLLKRARCWFTALELTPDDGPRESEETDDDAAPSGYWQYGGELTTPDPTAWSVNGWPTLTLAKRTPLLFADNKAIYLALISRHFRNKNPGKPWSLAQESSHGFPRMFGTGPSAHWRPLVKGATADKTLANIATAFRLSKSQALSRMAQQRLYQVIVGGLPLGHDTPGQHLKLLVESPVVTTLYELVGRAISLADSRGPFYEQEWASILASDQYRNGTASSDIIVQRALFLGLRRSCDRRHDEALTLLRGNLFEVITEWHLSNNTPRNVASDLAPETTEETAAGLFSRLKTLLTTSMRGELVRLKLADQCILGRGHKLPQKTAVDLWILKWLVSGAATTDGDGQICENLLTASPYPIWESARRRPPQLDAPDNKPSDTWIAHIDAITASNAHAPPYLNRTGGAVIMNRRQDEEPQYSTSGSTPMSPDSELIACINSCTAALEWLAKLRKRTPWIEPQPRRDPTAPVSYQPPVLFYCTSKGATLLMTGLWVPNETEHASSLARAARTLHQIWRHEAKYRTLWACTAAPHRLDRWASERARAEAVRAIADTPPSSPEKECPLCYEQLSNDLPTADPLSSSAPMFACPSRFPGHTLCRHCEYELSKHLTGQTCPLCRAPRYQSLLDELTADF